MHAYSFPLGIDLFGELVELGRFVNFKPLKYALTFNGTLQILEPIACVPRKDLALQALGGT